LRSIPVLQSSRILSAGYFRSELVGALIHSTLADGITSTHYNSLPYNPLVLRTPTYVQTTQWAFRRPAMVDVRRVAVYDDTAMVANVTIEDKPPFISAGEESRTADEFAENSPPIWQLFALHPQDEDAAKEANGCHWERSP